MIIIPCWSNMVKCEGTLPYYIVLFMVGCTTVQYIMVGCTVVQYIMVVGCTVVPQN